MLIKRQRENIQINKIINKKGYSKRLRKSRESLGHATKSCLPKLENVKEMSNFLDRYHITKLNQAQMSKLN